MNPKRTVERGDIIYVNFDPSVGHEMNFNRPAIVISPSSFNKLSNIILVCPLTTKPKGSPWEIEMPNEMKTKGVIRVDHLKSIDKSRCQMHQHRIEIKESSPVELVEELLARLGPLVT
jgi:mRNA interferase MazF